MKWIVCALALVLVGCQSGIKTAERREPPSAPYGVGVRPQKSGPTIDISTSGPVKQAEKLFDSKDYPRLLSHVRTHLENPALSPEEREALWVLRMRAWEETKDLNSLLATPMSETELLVLSRTATSNEFKTVCDLKLGEGKLLESKPEEAREYFNRVLGNAPGTEWANKATEYLKGIEKFRRVEPKTIGVVLPLTGKNARIAQRTLRGIQLGLGLNGKGVSSFRLAIVDSEGNPELARKGVERLLEEDNVIAIIGGLLSKTAPAEAAQANDLKVPMISLSLRSGITDMGPSIFRNSLTTEMQVRQLVKTAMEDQGLRRFAILYPNDSYGVEAANLFWDEVSARGGQVTAAQIYSPKSTDFRAVAARLASTAFLDARSEEARVRSREIKEANEKKPKALRSNTQENLLSPIVDFDAIFIPDGLKALGQLAATLAYTEIKNVKLLGTNLWNSPGLAKRAGPFAGRLLFVDSYAPTDQRFQNLLFVREYTQLFGEGPGLFEIQGYDSALILRQLISQGATSRDSITRELARLNNLPGLLSPLSVLDVREIVRPVLSLTLDKENIVPYRPASLR